MARAESFGFARDPSRQRPLPLPYENRVDMTCGLVSPRVLKKQSPARVASVDTRHTFDSGHGIYLDPRERREQRKLKRMSEIVKAQAIASQPFEPRPPNNSRTSKPQSPPYSVGDIANYLDAPKKLTRKSPNHPVPSGWYQPSGVGSSVMAPAGSYNTPHYIQEPHIPYSGSPGELQRQSAISQRLRRKCQIGSPNPVEMGAYLGGLERSHEGDGWVDGFRLEVEKPLQRVYAQRLQQGSRCGFMASEKPKKVRFASVVECAEF